MNNFKIKEITSEEGLQIIEKLEPLGLFIINEENGTFTGIDNSTKDAWTEEFEIKRDCIDWLNGKPLEDINEEKKMINWLQNNYLKFVEYCKKNYPDYPEVCDRIVILISIYLKKKFSNEKIYICVGEYKRRYHWWIKIDNKIIDTVKFQFTCSNEEFNNRTFNTNINIIQDDIENYNEMDTLEVTLNNAYLLKTYVKIIKAAKESKDVNQYLSML